MESIWNSDWPHIGVCTIIKGPILLAQEAMVLLSVNTKR